MNSLLQDRQTIVFVGAGISKESPSHLLSWWEYNHLIIQETGILGAEAIGVSDPLLDAEEILEKVPASTISDYLFNYSAGQAYFPLLKVLEGTRPNRNHHLLAHLARDQKISAVITTNFDSLIERAFAQQGIPYAVYASDQDFSDTERQQAFPIYKIHGSVTDTATAIDTASQKTRGLSSAKKLLLDRLFQKYHIIFMGFSGEDFAFGRDYFPLQKASQGVTWILNPSPKSHPAELLWIEDPKAYEPLSIHVRKILGDVRDFRLCVASIPVFCAYMNWPLGSSPTPQENIDDSDPADPPACSARQTVRDFLQSMAVTVWGCIGMCIDLLHVVKGIDYALTLAIQTDQALDRSLSSCSDGRENRLLLPLMEQTVPDLLTECFPYGTEQIPWTDRLVPLCDSLANIFRAEKMYPKAIKYFYLSLCITHQRLLEHLLENDCSRMKVSYNNMSTTKMRIGSMLTDMSRYADASRFYGEAVRDALQAEAFYDLSAAYYCCVKMDLSLFLQKDPQQTALFSYRSVDLKRLYSDIWSAIRLAQRGGNNMVLCDAYCHMAALFASQGMIPYAILALSFAENYSQTIPNGLPYREMIEEITNSLPPGTEAAAELPKAIQYCQPAYPTPWDDCRERDILSTEEGQEAFRLVCDEKEVQARQLLKETADACYGDSLDCSGKDLLTCRRQLYLAELFSYCYIKLEAKAQNSYGIKTAETYLLRCLGLEINLWQTEYMTEITSLLAQYYYANHMFEKAIFYADFCLCLCDDPVAHGIILVACAVAALSCMEVREPPETARYVKQYFHLAEQFPEASIPEIASYLRSWQEEHAGS